MRTERRGALLTGNTKRVADWLSAGGIAFTGFGQQDMYAMFSTVNPAAMELMATIKGRGRRPFVRTTAPDFAEELVQAPGIASTVTLETRRKVQDIFTHELVTGPRGHPIGVLLVANTEEVPRRLLGETSIGGTSLNTVGFMVSGPDQHYLEVVRRTPTGEDNHLLVGTSANLTADKRDRGSGHHRLAGIIRDFGGVGTVCIFVPPESTERKRGPSTSIVYIEENGQIAYLARIGSLGEREVKSILESVSVREVKDTDNVRVISPYEYTKIEEILWGGLYKIIWAATRRSDLHISPTLPHMLHQFGPQLHTA